MTPVSLQYDIESLITYCYFDAHHAKTDLKVFVVVISKGGWARVAAPIVLLIYDTDFLEFESFDFIDHIL